MTIDSPRISVAIVTRNRPESLQRTLVSLRRQCIQPYEVVVSDDSTGEHIPATQKLCTEFACRYISGPHRGLYANRNHVFSACAGTHVRTMDDDHEFPDGHFRQVSEAVAKDPHSVWVIGEYFSWTEIGAPPHPCPGQLHSRGYSVHPPDPDHCWAISDGATVYPRHIPSIAGPMIEDFKFGAAYLEYGSRLHFLSVRIRHLSSTYIIHHMNEVGRSFPDGPDTMAARLCAMLLHSWIYSTDLRSRVTCSTEIAKMASHSPTVFLSGLRMALPIVKATATQSTRAKRTVNEDRIVHAF